jgi:hypothetical protein
LEYAERQRDHHWYTRIPENERLVLDAAATWLRPTTWQWFVTLTFPWNVKSETADLALRQLIDGLERKLRTNLGYVAGKERMTADGRTVPWHFHLLITSSVPVPQSAIEQGWKDIVKLRNRNRGCLAASDTIQVDLYQTGRRGVEYCLKKMTDCSGDWILWRLHEFLPNSRGTDRPNHKSVRAAQRAERRREAAEKRGALALSPSPMPKITSPCGKADED